MSESMHHDTGINGTTAGAGLSILLTVFGFVKIHPIAEACGEYLPMAQMVSVIIASICGLIVIWKFLKGKS